MKPWPHVLREHDPVAPLTAEEAMAIRHAVVVEARRVSATSVPSTRLLPVLALGSALVVAVTAGVFVARAQPEAAARISASGEVRQLQFATPGGTRIIWQFNSGFSLGETHP